MSPERRDFADRKELATALADAVSAELAAVLAERERAAIAVSGGSTPAKFFSALGKRKEVPWEQVTVTLVDERWVEETSDRSNALLVNEKLLQGPAAVAHFLPLYTGGPEPDAAAVARTNAALAEVDGAFAAAVLGMGNDGHTASFFPGGDALEEALTGTGPAVAIRAPNAGEPRITLTLRRILKSRRIFLHIEGEEKAETLQRALGEGPVAEMPVRAVLRQTETPVTIFWSP